ncbi:PadR family transcriptional regulator [Peptostreptococcus porci]|uniref:PadR family transcriptional regulator n=1 Tax=Peptostreptococcus porci TaxID=2652282 RepID=UPI002A766199|nr:PadR family transcriptional regulator [Peptostreptococcus porci]MDY2795056.1 PadR family transcriptional regulator [Peptostreptococcus porci]MDY5436216.1 PadR family transcriptional regulator [Peptostreptococcus porci]MDY5479307.1 PadR family transcriptional regulator [Peptostreptococcus porci]MDY6232100.1 PadR family transcriptional regulator [Peptostreptococcus porci]
MDSKLKRIYIPMSETAFYILFCLQSPQHGYGIGNAVKEMTSDEVVISPGTMYGTLSKMEKDGLIMLINEVEKRKIYEITDLGREILDIELRRIKRLYKNSIGDDYHGENNHKV